MVRPEQYDLNGDLPPNITRRKTSVDLSRLERAANGAWFVIADLSFDFHLRDGRKVSITKQVRLRGQQTGTKPHKGGFKRKKA